MKYPVLSIERLDLSVNQRPILTGVSFTLPQAGLTALMGPLGSGKSALMKWISGSADPIVFSGTCAEAHYCSAPLDGNNRPLLISQHGARTSEAAMRLFDDRLRSDPRLLCVDEVTAHLSTDDADRIMTYMAEIARRRSLLIVTHNQRHVAEHADNVMLIAAGKLQEFTPAREFFESPRSEAGRQFIGTGSVALPSPGALSRHLRSDLRALPEGFDPKCTGGEGENLHPVCNGKLYLCQSQNDGFDIPALRAAGVTGLVFLDPQKPQLAPIEQQGLAGIWCPDAKKTISISDCKQRCRDLQTRLDAQERLAVVGRAGDVSAARVVVMQLVYMGLPAAKAVEVFQHLAGDSPLSVVEEQYLWDLELALDLEQEGLDMPVVPDASLPDYIKVGTKKSIVAAPEDPAEEVEQTFVRRAS